MGFVHSFRVSEQVQAEAIVFENNHYTSFHNSAHSRLPNPRTSEKSFENGSIVKQSGNDVEGCRSEKVLVQPNMRVFLQYSVRPSRVIIITQVCNGLNLFDLINLSLFYWRQLNLLIDHIKV